MNLNTDFDYKILPLKPDKDGEVIATLISSKFNKGNNKAVLYLHGYIDYFFHPHVCKEFIEHNFDFYALDLRKYGRSLMPHQRPNYCESLDEYFEEIAITIQHIQKINKVKIYLLGHSTGGLIAVSYLNSLKESQAEISGLILNAPFFNFNQSAFKKKLIYVVASVISSIFPYAKVNGALSSVYAQSLHKDYFGEWDFNLNWKPINGFPTYFKWIVAINIAQKKLSKSQLQIPVLVMHSSKSIRISKFSEEARTADSVLNIEDMKTIGKQLGPHSTLLQIDNALHDIFLSSKDIRTKAFKQMFNWLEHQV